MSRPTAAELAGRDRELAAVGELITALTGGRGGLAWIRGEPGIGKSALVDAVTARAAAVGCQVFRGSGDELAPAFPLPLMADCLGISERSADPRGPAGAVGRRGPAWGRRAEPAGLEPAGPRHRPDPAAADRHGPARPPP